MRTVTRSWRVAFRVGVSPSASARFRLTRGFDNPRLEPMKLWLARGNIFWSPYSFIGIKLSLLPSFRSCDPRYAYGDPHKSASTNAYRSLFSSAGLSCDELTLCDLYK